jgi:hypothetical protein
MNDGANGSVGGEAVKQQFDAPLLPDDLPLMVLNGVGWW